MEKKSLGLALKIHQISPQRQKETEFSIRRRFIDHYKRDVLLVITIQKDPTQIKAQNEAAIALVRRLLILGGRTERIAKDTEHHKRKSLYIKNPFPFFTFKIQPHSFPPLQNTWPRDDSSNLQLIL